MRTDLQNEIDAILYRPESGAMSQWTQKGGEVVGVFLGAESVDNDCTASWTQPALSDRREIPFKKVGKRISSRK